jgi:hypothetical protein
MQSSRNQDVLDIGKYYFERSVIRGSVLHIVSRNVIYIILFGL